MKTLFLAWQNPKSRAWFPVGRLSFDGIYYQFVYTQGAKEAQANFGFQLLYSFPALNRVYTSAELFPLFSNRVMRRSRPDYKNYIKLLNIPESEDDAISILSRSGGRKVTDHYEVFPCPEPDENGLYKIHFFAHGLPYFPPSAIERIHQLQTQEMLYLANEFQNPHDSKSLLLCTKDHYIVGYCPRYLVDDVFKLKEKNSEINVQVERVNPVPAPLQLRLLCNLTAKWPEDFSPFSSREYQPILADIPAECVTT
ncbi:DNA-binding protein [Sphaerospermopsis aphanizomenoides BCCUSP55]|uniref:HIRAN domain-containing protein n=1 Tax=Sphaerospermopsis aphanizomenoides TaxID=459663 RepID=UPI0019063358|nr:HIRAN domain-containing protein [Sphaerospermopsis aphanizomenoides]MBK1988274.1 DNA-binding protein [Sphaerospermopsis aphanizomenoides BCCUSP55]